MSAVRPGPGPLRPYLFPAFVRSTLTNGVEVIVAPYARLPLATVRIVVEAGAACDGAGHEGESWLTAKSLIEGTRRLPSEEIAVAIEQLGGELAPESDWNDVSMSTTIRAGAVPEALALMSSLLREPVFPEEGVLRNRSEQFADREQARRDPRQYADEMFASVAFASDARFATPETGVPSSITALNAEVVREFHRRQFAPARTCVIVAGDVEPDAVVQRVEELLGSWDAVASAAERSGVDRPVPGAGVHVVNRAQAPQTELRIGHVGIPRMHPDYYAAVVMNSVFGGLFNSRINLNLRERHGFTYGAFSGFDWRVQAGPFMISTAVQTDATGPAVREVLHEIDRMRSEPITEEERSLAVDFLAGVFPIRYETTVAVAAGLTALRIFRLPPDYFDAYRDRIRAVTAEDVLQAARRHLRPEDLHVLAVGDAGSIEPQLAELGRGVARVA